MLGATLFRQASAQGTATPPYPSIDVEYDFPASAALGVPSLVSDESMGALSFKQRVENLSKRIGRSEDLLGAFASEANASLAELLPVIQNLAAATLRERSRADPSPAFPSGVADILHDLGSRADQLDELRVDDSELLTGLKQEASRVVSARLAGASELERAANAASVLASVTARKLRFIGGCPRAMRGCPLGWTGQGGACSPPPDYEGWCGDVDVEQMSASGKEDFAWKCGASWPCVPCVTHFGGCPEGWSEKSGLCVAPPGYDGICSPVMDFASFSATRMAEWSAICSARWPCA